jgi:hypothetical protein
VLLADVPDAKTRGELYLRACLTDQLIVERDGTLLLLAIPASTKLQPIVERSFARYASPSPAHQLLAYAAFEGRGREVLITTLPTGVGRWPVSVGGGDQPVWSRDGRQLYWIAPDQRLMGAAIQFTAGQVRIGTPSPFFRANVQLSEGNSTYDVAPDGRFLMWTRGSSDAVTLTALVNWRADR